MLRQLKDFFQRCCSRGPRGHQATPTGDQLDTVRNAHQNTPSPLSRTRATTDNEASNLLSKKYFDSAQRLRGSFPQTCSWLEQEDLDFAEGRPVTGGRYADIWKGRLDGRDVVIKSYRCYICFDCDCIRMRFYRQAHAYSILSHRNIAPLVGIYSTLKHPFCLVFDSPAERPNLTEYLKGEPTSSKVQLVAGIARGLHHMHDLGVVHGNLDGTNVVIDSDGTPRIAGMGSAFVQSSPVAWSEDPPELTRYSAPELASPDLFGLAKAQITKSSDVYTFGVLAYEIFAGSRVFPDLLDISAIYSMSAGIRPPRPSDPELSDRVWDMINRCWANSPSQRITIAEAISILESELRQICGPPQSPLPPRLAL